MTYDNIAIIILAAGKGKRMKSDTAKVLHPVGGRPMILHVLDTAMDVAGTNVVVVVGHQADKVKQTIAPLARITFSHQVEQLGTGHAALCAMPFLPPSCKAAVILCGDVPLITADTIRALIGEHFYHGNTITLLAVTVKNPCGYGRVIRSADGDVEAIVEETDATEEERRINLINSGIYCVNKDFLVTALSRIESANAQQEIYLTDIVKIGRIFGKKVGMRTLEDPSEAMGVNNLDDLRRVEAVMRARNLKIT